MAYTLERKEYSKPQRMEVQFLKPVCSVMRAMCKLRNVRQMLQTQKAFDSGWFFQKPTRAGDRRGAIKRTAGRMMCIRAIAPCFRDAGAV